MIEIVNDSRGVPHKYVIFMGYQISVEELSEMAHEMGFDLVGTDDDGVVDVDVSLLKVPNRELQSAGKSAFKRMRNKVTK
jgi:hypothetical protein